VCKELGREIEGPCAYYLTSYACTLGFSEAIQYTYPNALISLHKPTSHRAWDLRLMAMQAPANSAIKAGY